MRVRWKKTASTATMIEAMMTAAISIFCNDTKPPSALEATEFLTLPDVVAGRYLRADQARGNLRHADRHERHQADDRVRGLDEDDRPGRDVSQVGLRVHGLDRVGAFRVGL